MADVEAVARAAEAAGRRSCGVPPAVARAWALALEDAVRAARAPATVAQPAPPSPEDLSQ